MTPRPPAQIRRLLLRDTVDVVTRCRDFTRDALSEWHWMSTAREHAEDVLLLVSEVVANACLHAGGPRTLVLDCTDERLRIEVADGSPIAPAPRPRSDPARPGGHGLLIVERLARGWGSVPTEDGKCVWLEVDSPPRFPESREPRCVSS